MSDEQEAPSVPEPTSALPSLDTSDTKPEVETKKSPKWISATDLPDIVNILVKADEITPQEAVNRLNNMVRKGSLLIVPLIGTKRKS